MDVKVSDVKRDKNGVATEVTLIGGVGKEGGTQVGTKACLVSPMKIQDPV